MRKFIRFILLSCFAMALTLPVNAINSFDTKMTITKVRVAKKGNSTYIVGSSYEGTLIRNNFV